MRTRFSYLLLAGTLAMWIVTAFHIFFAEYILAIDILFAIPLVLSYATFILLVLIIVAEIIDKVYKRGQKSGREFFTY